MMELMELGVSLVSGSCRHNIHSIRPPKHTHIAHIEKGVAMEVATPSYECGGSGGALPQAKQKQERCLVSSYAIQALKKAHRNARHANEHNLTTQDIQSQPFP